ncbi:hypothetical protein [Micromonospora sp. KC606]|uniref:hypothetical protein n=1 Tax=Micromonospora sp. KC606 TaxID=2530379 RepID=UPI001A9FA423|nr:hypothetical protein [Micromonospora sp. KC606]
MALAGALLAALPLTGCGAPPTRGATAPSISPGLGTPSAVGVPPGGPPTVAPPGGVPTPVLPVTAIPGHPQGGPGGTAPGTSASPSSAPTAAPCLGRPSADRVVRLLRGRVLPRDVPVRATTGPLCADGWQYTVLAVTGHEELQAVTRGEPTALRLVTVGTDVCSIEVRATAPPAIRTLACDETLPGA